MSVRNFLVVLIVLIAACLLVEAVVLPVTCNTATWSPPRSSETEEKVEIATLRCVLGCKIVVSYGTSILL